MKTNLLRFCTFCNVFIDRTIAITSNQSLWMFLGSSINCVILIFEITSFDNRKEKQFLRFSFEEFNVLVWLSVYNSSTRKNSFTWKLHICLIFESLFTRKSHFWSVREILCKWSVENWRFFPFAKVCTPEVICLYFFIVAYCLYAASFIQAFFSEMQKYCPLKCLVSIRILKGA